MGLPVSQLIVATNRNDILHRFMSGNQYAKGDLYPTLSPSMDIMVSSNFERLLFDLHGRNGPSIAALMTEFRQTGGFTVEDDRWTEARKLFDSLAVRMSRPARPSPRCTRLPASCSTRIPPSVCVLAVNAAAA